MKKHLISLLLGMSLLGCLAPGPEEEGEGGATSGVAMYAYDNSAKQLLVWKDLGVVYDDAGLPAVGATYAHDNFTKVTPLAWNGVAIDPTNNQLYLVGESGDIVRINRIRNQVGSLSSSDVYSFKLDPGTRLDGSKFGQAAVDPSSGTLYVAENGTSGTRIWAVDEAYTRTTGNVALKAVKVAGDSTDDTGGHGVAASGGDIFGFFENGDDVTIDRYSGPRVRKGSGTSFPADSQVLVGSSTLLGKYGPLGLDRNTSNLYVGIHGSGGVVGGAPVLRFALSKFSGGSPNQAPSDTLGNSSTLTTLRFLAHPGKKDWLVAGPEAGDQLWIWKQPSAGGTQFQSKALGGSRAVRGVALDPN